MSITKYQTTGICRINTIQVERESAQSVWIGGRKHAKRSEYWSYFGSFEEAKDHLLEQAEGRVNHAKVALEYAKGILGNVKGLQPATIQDDFEASL